MMSKKMLTRLFGSSGGSSSSNVNVTDTTNLIIFRQLPVELQMEIFKYLPRDYIPEHWWQIRYFVQLWSALHIGYNFEYSDTDLSDCLTVTKVDYEDTVELRRRTWYSMSTARAKLIVATNQIDVPDIALPISMLREDLPKKNDQLHGVCKYYNRDGSVYEVVAYRAGRRHGEAVDYFPNAVQICSNYHYGQLHGWRTKVHSIDNRKKINVMEYYFKNYNLTLLIAFMIWFGPSVVAFLGLRWLQTLTGLYLPHGGLVWTFIFLVVIRFRLIDV